MMKNGKKMFGMTAFIYGVMTVLVSLPCPSQSQASERQNVLELTRDGKTLYRIVIAKDASGPERTAAGELKVYLEKVTGAEFPITAPDQKGSGPVIGVGPGVAKALYPKIDLARSGKSGLGDDGIVIKTCGRDLILSGAEGSKRGTLYAVYTFLEDRLGVRWWNPTEESVPFRKNLVVSDLNIVYRPQLFSRDLRTYGMFTYPPKKNATPRQRDWTEACLKHAVRLKLNGEHTPIPDEWGGYVSYAGANFAHTFYSLLPPDRYFKDHPEWYSLVNGKRIDRRGQLCMTNHEMLEELTKQAMVWIRGTPGVQVVSVSPNDWVGFCQCEKCKTVDDENGSAAGSLLYGVNRVAEVIEQKFPGIYVETLAYGATRPPPKIIRPRKNVMIRFAFLGRGAFQSFLHPRHRANVKEIISWSEISPNLSMWDYSNNYAFYTPHPNFRTLGPDIRLFTENKAKAYFSEAQAFNLCFFVDLRKYLMSHLLWDPFKDSEAIINDFINGFYGESGPYIKAYFDLLHEIVKEVERSPYSAEFNAYWLDLDTLNKAEEIFRKAEKVSKDDKQVSQRLEKLRISLDNQWLRHWGKYRDQAKLENKPFLGPTDFDKALLDFKETIIFYLQSSEKDGDAMYWIFKSWADASHEGRPKMIADPVYYCKVLKERNDLWNRSTLAGAQVVSFSCENAQGKPWMTQNLVDLELTSGWCSTTNYPFPFEFVFKMAEKKTVDRAVLYNGCQEEKFPGISAKDFEIHVSVDNKTYELALSSKLQKIEEPQTFDFEPRQAQYVKLVITSNHGYKRLTELMEFYLLEAR